MEKKKNKTTNPIKKNQNTRNPITHFTKSITKITKNNMQKDIHIYVKRETITNLAW
jgi:hypothetical protein